MKAEDFDERWEKTQSEPQVKEVEVEKIEPDLSMTGLLANFEEIARKSKDQGKLDEEAYNELINRTESLKKLLKKVDADDIVKQEWQARVRTKMKNMLDRFRP